MLPVLGHRGFHLVPRQVLREILAAGRTPSVADVALDRDARLVHGLGQPAGRIGRLRRIAKINFQLIRIVEVTLAAASEHPLQKFGDRQLQRFLIFLELSDGRRLRTDRLHKLLNQRLACCEVVGNRDAGDSLAHCSPT